ncbi:MAG TPA: aminoglycoside phosphotransferase family protein [Anaerolineae bacterium]|nr:aminoglycoside phosphotransferase family protein [Anaerolineae bacterium]
MLTKPEIDDGRIGACLREEYGLTGVRVAFLPLGADENTAVYRAVDGGGRAWFVKLRRGAFDETSVELPRFLADEGIAQIIPPIYSRRGALWANVGGFRLIVYPFVEGRDGYEVSLSARQWVELGGALKRIHAIALPAGLRGRIGQEGYRGDGRQAVLEALDDIVRRDFEEPVAARAAALLRARRADVLYLVARAERLAGMLRGRDGERVLCHSDLHAGNVLIAAGGGLYMVDWDEPILAPKERDLMYAGGGLMGGWRTPEEEEALFYRGYGEVEIDRAALAYYRYERIVQDIAAYCRQLLGSDEGGEDRERSLRFLASNWDPGGVVEIAYRSDRTTEQG